MIGLYKATSIISVDVDDVHSMRPAEELSARDLLIKALLFLLITLVAAGLFFGFVSPLMSFVGIDPF